MNLATHEPKIRETIVHVKGRDYARVIVDYGIVEGVRKRESHKTRADAEQSVATWKQKQKVLSRKIGEGARRFLNKDIQDAASAKHILGAEATLTNAATLYKTFRQSDFPSECLPDAAEAVRKLDGRATLLEAAQFFMEHHFPEGGTRTIDLLVEDYLENRRNVDRRPDTLRDIRCRLGCASPRLIERTRGGTLRLKPFGFAKDFAGVPVAHVNTKALEKWMAGLKGKSKHTWRNMRVHLVGLFNFAITRKYIRENPAIALATPRVSKSAKRRPYIMPVEEVEKALRYTAEHLPDMVPYVALCTFAGIRPMECQRMDWGQISFERREIDIKADMSKTGDERFVEMADNLVEWLLPHRNASGPIYWSRVAMDQIRAESGAHFEQDCMRHSFGSYHMAHFENAGKTALQMGHRTIDTTFEHYRRAVRKEDAARFWAVRPQGATQVIKPATKWGAA